MRFVVTGTSGFIGTSFCERFAQKSSYEVVGLDRRPPREPFPGVRYVQTDLTDRRAVRQVLKDARPDVIVHLAAQARVEPSLTAASPTYSDNVLATLNLLAAAEEMGSRLTQFVYASSETVYGEASSYPTAETATPNPRSPYAASKAASELLVTRALPTKATVLRSGMGYGPRSDHREQVIARFIRLALADDQILFPRGLPLDREPTRDANYVANFLDGVERAIERTAVGTFNIASGQEVSVLGLAERIVGLVGKGRVVRTDSFRYRPGEEGARTWLDITKARAALDYEPKVTLEGGLSRTIEWSRSHPNYFETASTEVAR